jgi:uncharacterized phage-associated protein
MAQIRFRFNPEKLIHALAFFSVNGVADLDTMKAAKLLYFADKAHLVRYGRPILGDDYYCMKHGPIPTLSLNMIQACIAGTDDMDDSGLMADYFDVVPGKYPRLMAKREPDLDVFSDSDLEVLQEVLSTYGSKSAWQLREIAHQQKEVQAADEQRRTSGRGSVPLPFESFLDATNEGMLSLVREGQENRDFAASLTW